MQQVRVRGTAFHFSSCWKMSDDEDECMCVHVSVCVGNNFSTK